METFKDFLEQETKVGDKCIRPYTRGHMSELAVCEVISIDESREYGDIVEIKTKNNIKTGWTYPRRLLKLTV